jgi:hypothetical protein
LHGWEDYDLWRRTADRGLRGVLVPEVLARYRRADHSIALLDHEHRHLTRVRLDDPAER